LHYFLVSSVGQNQIAINEVGGGREGLNFDSIKSFFIPLPPKEEQAEIVFY
jgi:type I restriction enzyme S subunit